MDVVQLRRIHLHVRHIQKDSRDASLPVDLRARWNDLTQRRSRSLIRRQYICPSAIEEVVAQAQSSCWREDQSKNKNKIQGKDADLAAHELSILKASID